MSFADRLFDDGDMTTESTEPHSALALIMMLHLLDADEQTQSLLQSLREDGYAEALRLPA